MISETQQLKSILQHSSNLLITGGPGSGKTTSAIVKAKRLISELNDYQKILFLSFSNGAIFQVKQKARELLTRQEFSNLNIQTYHSFCFSLIKSYGLAFGIKKPAQIFPPEEKTIVSERQKVTDLDAYLESQCFDEGRISFEKMPGVVNKFLKNVQILTVVQSCYPIIIIDEFQDSVDDEWHMLQKFGKNITVIALADSQQRIYSWRPGASAHRIQEFSKIFKPLVVDLKAINYRSSTSGILEYAGNIRDSKPNNRNPNICIITYAGINQVSFILKNAILKLRKDLTPTLGQPPTIAILTGKNDSALFISSALNKTTGKIPFQIRHELLLNPEGVIISQRFIGRILEYAQDKKQIIANTLEELGNFCLISNIRNSQKQKSQALQLFEYAKQIRNGESPKLRVFVSDLPEIITSVRKEMTGSIENDWNLVLGRVTDWLEKRFPTLLNYLNGKNPFYGHSMTKKLNSMFGEDGYATIIEYLNRVHLVSRTIGSNKPKYPVTVMTMHKSKGKEYDAVILFDHNLNHSLMLPGQSEAENRLLIRVALTRARHKVSIIHKHDSPPYFLN